MFGLDGGSYGGDASNAPARRHKAMRTTWKDRIMNLIVRARTKARVRVMTASCFGAQMGNTAPYHQHCSAHRRPISVGKAQLKRSFSDDSASSESDGAGGGDEIDASTACSACSRASQHPPYIRQIGSRFRDDSALLQTQALMAILFVQYAQCGNK